MSDMNTALGGAAEDNRDRYRAALIAAREALHRACLKIGSTEGFRDDFDAINGALDDTQARNQKQ